MLNLVQVNHEKDEMVVSARELHEKLGVNTEYRHWIKRMFAYGFEEGVDFNLVKFDRVQNEGGREIQREMWDYELTIAMAKELCMLARTENGKKIRKYFLELERAWNSPDQVMARALQLATQKSDELKEQCQFLQGQIMEQQMLIEEMKPKAKYLEQILGSKSSVLITQIAKDYGMSAVKLNRLLHQMRIQYKMNHQWMLYANYQGNGYVYSKTHTIPTNDGGCICRMQTEWTQKGRLFLYEELKKEGILPLIERSA